MTSIDTAKSSGSLKDYFDYRLCISRKRYAQFFIFWALMAVVLSLLNPLAWVIFFWASFPIFFILSLQRLNDIGRNRWYIALGILPVIGFLFFIYTLLAPSKKPKTSEPKI